MEDRAYVGIVERVSKNESIASGRGLVDLILGNLVRTISVGQLSNKGKGACKNDRVRIVDANICKNMSALGFECYRW